MICLAHRKTDTSEFGEFDPTLSDDESKGRVDIRYCTNAGEHIIVELKRAGRKLHLHELQEQGQKYRAALDKCLKAAGHDQPHISIVFVVGQRLHEQDDVSLGERYVKDTLSPLGARVVHYEQLIKSAREAYQEYLSQSEKIDRLDGLLSKL